MKKIIVLLTPLYWYCGVYRCINRISVTKFSSHTQSFRIRNLSFKTFCWSFCYRSCSWGQHSARVCISVSGGRKCYGIETYTPMRAFTNVFSRKYVCVKLVMATHDRLMAKQIKQQSNKPSQHTA